MDNGSLLINLSSILPSMDKDTIFDFAISLTSNQHTSKQWLVECISKYSSKPNPVVVILGGWYGSYLIPMCFQYIKPQKVVFIDINQRAINIAQKIHSHQTEQIHYICCDIEKNIDVINDIYADIVLNTSCEHMFDMSHVINVNKQCLYGFQSCDNYNDPGHINVPFNTDDFENQCGLTEILYKGRKNLGNKNRFMIVGTR